MKAQSGSVAAQIDLTGKVALVTGGCGHLGSAFVDALAEAGASVVSLVALAVPLSLLPAAPSQSGATLPPAPRSPT